MPAWYGRRLSVREIFNDFKGRRAGILKALTDDAENLFKQCDPDKENMYLYGYPDGNWEVMVPPSECFRNGYLPEPTVGINFAQSAGNIVCSEFIARHSDSWLLAVAFFHAGASGLDKKFRKKLFDMINDLPTVTEIVTVNNNQPKKRTSPGSNRNNLLNPKPVNVTMVSQGHGRNRPQKRKKQEESNKDRHPTSGK